jgi:hypothetical protein
MKKLGCAKCGGVMKKMAKGGATKMKKMQPGGSSGPDYPVSSVKPFKNKSAKIGVGILSGMLSGIGAGVLADVIKKRKENKAEIEAAKTARKTARVEKRTARKSTASTDVKKMGGIKKMQVGGQANLTKTMAGYNANTSTMKMGGAASLPVCRGGLVRMPDGSCGERKTSFKKGGIKKYAKGGATKFGMLSVKAGIDKNPKPTAADRIAGATKRTRTRKTK